MQTFKQYFDEVVSSKTRMKMWAAAKKNKAKIALGRKKAAKKLASPEKLQKRAEQQARNLIIKKILKGKNKADLSFAARAELEKKLKKISQESIQKSIEQKAFQISSKRAFQ